MKLYYAPGACSLADHIALIESGLPFDAEKVDLKAKTTSGGDDYTAINPKGYVPALALDDGSVLTENIAILSYIGGEAGALTPPAGLARIRTLETLAYISTELHKAFAPFFKPDSSDDAKAAAKEQLGKRFALIEEKLADQAFISGNEFGIADCYLFVMLFWARTKTDMVVPARLSAYYDRLAQRPAIKEAMLREELSQ